MKFGVIANIKKKQAFSVIKDIVKHLRLFNRKIIFDKALRPYLEKKYEYLEIKDLVKKTDILITIGGDGTLLMTAQFLKGRNIMILSINTGKLGFLNEFSQKDIPEILELVNKGEYHTQNRVMLNTKILRKEKLMGDFLVLNDVVITKEALARIIKLEIYDSFNRKIFSFLGDGLIIATPTGSTAHSLSAGGPIIYPALETFILTPICAHTLTLRPLIVAPIEVISVKVTSDHKNIYLTLDGQRGFKIYPHDIIKVNIAKERIKLIVSPKKNFYEVLQKKLKWGK